MLRSVPDCVAAAAIGTEGRAAHIEQIQVSPPESPAVKARCDNSQIRDAARGIRDVLRRIIDPTSVGCRERLMPGIPLTETLLPVKARPLLCGSEQLLYARLVRSLTDHLVFVKVALSQLLAVERSPTRRHSQYDANQLRQLFADFVICAPDFSVIAVIELDRRVRQREAQRVRDRWKNDMLQVAGISVIRVPSGDIPNEAALRGLLRLESPPQQQTAELSEVRCAS